MQSAPSQDSSTSTPSEDTFAREIGDFADIQEQAGFAVQAEVTKHYVPRCGPGCYGCCFLRVDVSRAGALLIAHTIRGRAVELKSQLQEQAIAERHGTAKYIKEQRPCTFLGAGGRCSIYAVRPFNCRNHFVLSDPKRCCGWKHYLRGGITALQSSNVKVEIQNLGEAFTTDDPNFPKTGPLAQMVLYAAKYLKVLP